MPAVAVAIPILLMMRFIELDDTLPGLVIPYVAFSLPLMVWILIGFFDEIPRELDDAAMVDGCTPRRRAARASCCRWSGPGSSWPPSSPPSSSGTSSWSVCYLINSQALKTIPLGAAGLISAQRPIDWNVAATVGVVTIIPIFIFSLFVAALHRARHHRRRRTLSEHDGQEGTTMEHELLAEGLGWAEGPTVLPDGRICFVESYRSQVSVWERGRGVSPLRLHGRWPQLLRARRRRRRCTSARTAAPSGPGARQEMSVPVHPAHRARRVVRAEIIATELDGKRLNGPNDLVFGQDGRLYFTDPGTYRPADPEPSYLFVLEPDGTGRLLAELDAADVPQRHRHRGRRQRRVGRVVHGHGPPAAPRHRRHRGHRPAAGRASPSRTAWPWARTGGCTSRP